MSSVSGERETTFVNISDSASINTATSLSVPDTLLGLGKDSLRKGLQKKEKDLFFLFVLCNPAQLCFPYDPPLRSVSWGNEQPSG